MGLNRKVRALNLVKLIISLRADGVLNVPYTPHAVRDKVPILDIAGVARFLMVTALAPDPGPPHMGI